jgi:hypothetical protein
MGSCLAASGEGSTNVTVGEAYVTVQGTNLKPDDVGSAVVNKIRDISDKGYQQAAAQNSGPNAYGH